MSKAILVMDMPSNCRDCVLCIASREKHTGQFCWRCINHPTIMIEKNGTKPDWCPLKPMPEKKDNAIGTNYQRFVKGYNACIDEILGDKE